jgi:hypothetical protein
VSTVVVTYHLFCVPFLLPNVLFCRFSKHNSGQVRPTKSGLLSKTIVLAGGARSRSYNCDVHPSYATNFSMPRKLQQSSVVHGPAASEPPGACSVHLYLLLSLSCLCCSPLSLRPFSQWCDFVGFGVLFVYTGRIVWLLA